MESGLLVSAHHSTLFPSSEIEPLRLPSSRYGHSGQHASQAVVLDTPSTGSLLLRVLHADTVLELLSLASKVSPIRFLFPSPICSAPAMFLDEEASFLYILAVTTSGSLYRLGVPIFPRYELWGPHPTVDHDEYLIRNAIAPLENITCVIVALPQGSILRLELDDKGTWSEMIFQPGSFLSSFIPTFGSSAEQAVPDYGTLRFWKTRVGCVASKVLSSNIGSREATPTANTSQLRPLLDENPPNLLRVFSRDEQLYLLAYIPPSYPIYIRGLAPLTAPSVTVLAASKTFYSLKIAFTFSNCLTPVLRPGIFSPFTLKTAIEQYTADQHAHVQGDLPQALLQSYASLEENIAAVVGCTVKLKRDPHTSAWLYDEYWSSLKRDWEGFVARCREIERAGRWPLALGVHANGILVVERERLGTLVSDDIPILTHRLAMHGAPQPGPPNVLISMLWMLREKLGPLAFAASEKELVDTLRHDLSFSFSDIIQDLVRKTDFHEEHIDEGLKNWLRGRIQAIDNLDAAVRATLDLVGALDVEVKIEEDEVELLLPTKQSDWTRALTASYIGCTITCRYEICLALMTLLFFLSDEVPSWDQSLLAEVFAVYRGLAMARYITQQPAKQPPRPTGTDFANPEDEITAQLGGMQVSSSGGRFQPTYSLLHRLLALTEDTSNLPGSAHRYLDTTGLLQSVTPAVATKEEVLFVERIRAMGYPIYAQELLSLLPRTRLALDLGRPDEASALFDSLTPNFGMDRSLTLDDHNALVAMLPAGIDMPFTWNAFVAAKFRDAGFVAPQIPYIEAAIASAPENLDLADLWSAMIQGYIELGQYDDAVSALVRCPYVYLKRENVVPLVYRICEDGATSKLISINFGELMDDVEEALSFKARNSDPRAHPSYSQVLYTWYISRGDYRNAAATMYHRAQKLQVIPVDDDKVLDLMEEQREANAIAINALSLLDEEDPSILTYVATEVGSESRKRRRISYIPESKYTVTRVEGEIVKLSDIRYEQALLIAKLDFVRVLPVDQHPNVISLPPTGIVIWLAEYERYPAAFATAHALTLDMKDLFIRLASYCLRLPRQTDPYDLITIRPSWLLSSDIRSWPGSPAEKGWRYLRQSLQQYDSAENEYGYTKAVIETMLSHSVDTSPQSWLTELVEKQNPESLIRMYLRYGRIEFALQTVLKMIKKLSDSNALAPRSAGPAWLPYNLIDQALAAANSATEADSPSLSQLVLQVQKAISGRIQKLQKDAAR
ncbi:hypothetical protein DL96DRAFT_1573284 [Flagelloscypha sp. PMI_526]|nr:hypothetical protein DL96DRAFT_1573284 [Flagelloscypha sp. PMI_526]